MHVAIIGGGVIGLNCAYYLHKEGHTVTVIERGDITGGCSFGNMGYVGPSHFIPLATPGIIAKGLRWMMSSSSPFYIKPRLNLDLVRWGFAFWKSATAKNVSDHAPYLNNLCQLTRHLMNDIKNDLPEPFDFIEKGCWLLWKNHKTGEHEKHLAEMAHEFGLQTKICTPQQVQELETEVEVDVAGGVLYTDDAHLNPAKFMQAMYAYLKNAGVKFLLNTEVTAFEKNNGTISSIITATEKIDADEIIIANGSWLQNISKLLGLYLPLQPGKGYSIVYENVEKNLQHPAILVDHRAATTPIGNWLRIGGTMELSGHSNNILPKRVHAIHHSFKQYYPHMNLPQPDAGKAWYGYRPVSPDGMPYIGRHKKFSNLSYAGGHAMIGVTAAAGTGKILSEIISGREAPFKIDAFDPARFE